MERIDVDQAKAQITLEEAASRCGATLAVHGSPPNVRIDCPFDCPGDHAGKRELSVNIDNPDKVFRCHNYECQFRGNLIHLMHGWLTGQKPSGGNVRGEDFKRVKRALVGEATTAAKSPTSAKPDPRETLEAPQEAPTRNVPLAESDNEKVRDLVGMEELFITDTEKMTPACSAYWRKRRSFLTEETCQSWGVGVRPGRSGTDKRGFSLRNHVVYPFLSEDNQVLCYVGRDAEFEEKIEAWESLSPAKRETTKPPMKYKFPAGFHRGLELYGQHSRRLAEHPEYRDMAKAHGIILVEGFNDVLALDQHGVPAVAICSNRITEEQAAKVARWARRLAGGKVSLMFDCESTGDEGAKEALWLLAQNAPDLEVCLAWSQNMHAGQFRDRQPESLTENELKGILLPALRN